MTTLFKLLSGTAAAVLIASPVFANQTDLSIGVENITITNNISAINLSVRNMAGSTDPADRNLRMVSAPLVIPVQGQLFCNDDLSGHVRIDRAQIVFGSAQVVSAQNGADILPIGHWSPSSVQTFNADYPQTNFSINAPLVIATQASGLVNFSGFNAVDLVEDRMDFFVENGAGSAADFMRVDDVFETTITLNAVGWCTRTTQNGSYSYAGVRSIQVPVHVFYHGDSDIADPVTTMDTANTVAAQTPSRARGQVSTRGPASAPPARNARPSRENHDRVDTRTGTGETGYRLSNVIVTSNHDEPRRGGVSVGVGDVNGDGRPSRGLILPAVQSVRTNADGASDQRVINYTGLEQSNTGVEPDEIDNRFAQTDGQNGDCPTIGSVVRREATNALIGAVFGSRAEERNRDRRTTRERLTDDAIDRITEC